LATIFTLFNDEVDLFINRLKAYGILKAVKYDKEQLEMSDLQEEDAVVINTAITNKLDCYYVFTYVGIVMMGSRVIKCYPKYINILDNLDTEFKQILRVLEKYNAKKQIINLYNGSDASSSFNT